MTPGEAAWHAEHAQCTPTPPQLVLPGQGLPSERHQRHGNERKAPRRPVGRVPVGVCGRPWLAWAPVAGVGPEAWLSLATDWPPPRAISCLPAAPNRPRWKELGWDVLLSRQNGSGKTWPATILALPYLGPVPWVGTSCHKQRRLAVLWGPRL